MATKATVMQMPIDSCIFKVDCNYEQKIITDTFLLSLPSSGET